MFNKHFFKFFGGLIVFMAIGILVAYGPKWYERQKLIKNAAQQERAYAEYMARYMEDTYGSTTPEGTLQMFIDALEKNDIDLAVKYVFVDDREKWRNVLIDKDEKTGLGSVIAEAKILQPNTRTDTQATFILTNKENIVDVEVVLNRLPGGIWKITEL